MTMTRNDITTRAAAMSLRMIELMDNTTDGDEFARYDKIAGRALQLVNSCSRMVVPVVGSRQEQEGSESPG